MALRTKSLRGIAWGAKFDHCSRLGIPSVAALAVLAMASFAGAQQPREKLREPVFRVEKRQPQTVAQQQPAQQQPAQQVQPSTQPANGGQGSPAEHPLMPAIRMAQNSLLAIDKNVKDYSCTMVKREAVGSALGDHEYIFLKVRHQPFSVYMYFLGPESIKGRECIYVHGQNNNKLVAHEGGRGGALLPTVSLDPTSKLAMRNQRYPITEIGLRNLTTKLIEVAQADSRFGECDVRFFKDAKVNGRLCTGLHVMHPVRRDNFRFHAAQVFIDNELQIPIRYASYDWPARAGEQPPLIEEYTYTNLKINNGFTDADFDRNNKQYGF